MIILSAPSKSGYTQEFETIAAARRQAASLLSGLRETEDGVIDLQLTADDLIEVESGGGDTTYCYATEEEADADLDGAYAVQYREVR